MSELEGQRHRRREREKKRRIYGWICLITYYTIILIIAIYLGPNLNLFFQILLLILLIILLLAGYYLSHIIFFKKKKTRISFGKRYQ